MEFTVSRKNALYATLEDGHDSEDPKQSTADMTAFVRSFFLYLHDWLHDWPAIDISFFWVLHRKLSLVFSSSGLMLSVNLMSKTHGNGGAHAQFQIDARDRTVVMPMHVQNLLLQMQNYLFLDWDALDEMGNRIDELEQSINDLRTEMGIEASPSPSAPLKLKEEPKSANDSA
ncbi:hypothetical protein JRO89_XS03G0174600 [Xanthoceras sorbifolium]|uniref:Uncharacterized protein n=1 Tax=Xanthoceras sorbifolium TaxID=99658 RepID=A0ABQ8IA96_9ROSI|nr:hypothetical protein JRO89_XS03G0174600 [Xanthoceras sorbifolium]